MAAHTACRGVALRSIGHVCAVVDGRIPAGRRERDERHSANPHVALRGEALKTDIARRCIACCNA